MAADFDVSKLTGFEGWVAGKLDSIEKRLDDLPCGETFKRLNKVENEISGIKGKAAVIGGIFGLAVAWIKGVFVK
ncbi:MAG: hypothetical protein WC481_08535 [Candidatus Omnitrophota bacterium]